MFLPDIFFNMDFSVTIALIVFKFLHTFLNICMEGTMSQIFYMGPSFYFKKCRNESFKK